MLQNFLKIYPKTMSAQLSNGQVFVKLVYAVEQYGVFTGPFEMLVRYQPEQQAQSGQCWAIVSNTNQGDGGAFERFFKTLELYLQDQAGGNPLEAVRSGARRHFEMYFPEMHCDLYKKPLEPKNQPNPAGACTRSWGEAGLKRVVGSVARMGAASQAFWNMGLAR